MGILKAKLQKELEEFKRDVKQCLVWMHNHTDDTFEAQQIIVILEDVIEDVERELK